MCNGKSWSTRNDAGVDLDIERMVEEAIAAAGVDDFADMDGLWERVAA